MCPQAKFGLADASLWYSTLRLRVGLVCAEGRQQEDEYEDEYEDEQLAASSRKVSPNRSGGKVV